MLNIIRHLRSDNPFSNLAYKSRRNKAKLMEGSGYKRAQSAKN